jgi:hypothetical protein
MILAVQAFPGSNSACARHYPLWKHCGFDRIVGIATVGGGCKFPAGMEYVEIGRNSYISGDHLPRRFIDTAAWLLSQPNWREASIIEWDTITLKQFPSVLNVDGLHAHLAGYGGGRFKALKFFHNPWTANIGTWHQVVKFGRQMIAEGDIELGHPDFFIGLLCQRFGLPITESLIQCYSQNTIASPWQIADARKHIALGAIAVHGVKSAEVLKTLLS